MGIKESTAFAEHPVLCGSTESLNSTQYANWNLNKNLEKKKHKKLKSKEISLTHTPTQLPPILRFKKKMLLFNIDNIYNDFFPFL